MRSRCGSTMKIGAGQALHLADAAEHRVELVQLLGQPRGLLLGEAVEVAGELPGLELVEQPDALLDRDEVGHHAAQPALGDVGLAGPHRLLHHGLLRLLLGADEQHALAAGDRLGDELERRVEALDRLGEVDDVDPVALREDERAHLGVPSARLVAEVDAGLQELAHRSRGHWVTSCGCASADPLRGRRLGSRDLRLVRHHPARDRDPRVCSVSGRDPERAVVVRTIRSGRECSTGSRPLPIEAGRPDDQGRSPR